MKMNSWLQESIFDFWTKVEVVPNDLRDGSYQNFATLATWTRLWAQGLLPPSPSSSSDPHWIESDRMPNIKIFHDDYAADYLLCEIHDHSLGTFVAWHKKRNIGKVNYPDHDDFMKALADDALAIPIYIYDHGHFVLSADPFHCAWDSGQVGVWIFTTEDLEKHFGNDGPEARVKARASAVSQIQYMNDVYSGNVWGFEIEDFDGGVADRCGGFVGDDALGQMKDCLPENLHNDLLFGWENREY